jgi:MFS family permease
MIVREHRLAPWFAVATVCLGAFMGQLDASIVTLGFPAIQRDFGVRLAAAQWVSLGYLLVLVVLLVPLGRWSDRVGRKLVYLYGFVVFTVASAACGFTGALWLLIGLRLVQAAGAAMLQANSVALVVTSVRPRQRRMALGVQAGAQALGLALGPMIGGVLVATVGWRWIFWINVPVGVLALTAGWFLLPRTRHRAPLEGADVGGVALLAVASCGLLLTLSTAAGLSLPMPVLVGLAPATVAAVLALIWWERRVSAPLLDPAALTSPAVRSGLPAALLAYLVLFGPLVVLPQVAVGDSAALTVGLMLSALPAGFGVAAVLADRVLPPSWSDRRRCVAGALLASVAVSLLALPVHVAGQTALLGLLGVGLGVFIPPNNASIMESVPDRLAATAGGMVNMARGLGTAAGVAAMTVALHTAKAAGAGIAGRTSAAMIVLGVAALTIVLISRWASATPPWSGETR